MAWSPQFVDNLCWRLKALGAPKVPWLQISLLVGEASKNQSVIYDICFWCSLCYLFKKVGTTWDSCAVMLTGIERRYWCLQFFWRSGLTFQKQVGRTADFHMVLWLWITIRITHATFESEFTPQYLNTHHHHHYHQYHLKALDVYSF